MSFASRGFAVVVSVAVLAAGGAEVASSTACSNTTTVNASLVSGIFIPSSILIGDLGCSGPPDANELAVYQYVAIAINDARNVAGAGIFSCYSEAVFGNLPGIDGGLLNFAVWVYAYNYEQFTAANKDGALVAAVNELNSVNRPDGSVFPFPVHGLIDGGGIEVPFLSALQTVCTAPATWVTTCSATSQASVQSLADCKPLALQTKPATSCNLPVQLPDGG